MPAALIRSRQAAKKLLAVLVVVLLATAGYAQLSANFSANNTQGCPGLTVQFTNLSTGNPTSYEWDLGNGNPSYVANPGAVYDDPGFYTITLIVFNGAQSDTLVWPDLIEVLPPPQPNFAASDSTGCDPFPVSFFNLTSSSFPIVSTSWDFGDGNGSAAQNPQHTYLFDDAMTVTLTVIDSMGCQATTTKPGFIDVDHVQAGFSTDSLFCNLPITVDFTNQSQGDGLSYSWNLGYGNVSSQANPSLTYISYDTLPISLAIESAYGCTDTIVQPLQLTEYQADFTYSVQCLENGMIMQYFPSANLTMENWFWTLADGTPSGQVSPSWFYPTNGPHTVQLISDGIGNCVDTVVHTYYPPEANFSVPDYFCQRPLTFQPSDSASGTGPLQYSWRINDDLAGTGATPNITYPVADSIIFSDFLLAQVVTNPWGCRDTMFDTLHYSRPDVHFKHSAPKGGCVPLVVTFQDSSNYNSLLVDYQWDFGNGFTASGPVVATTYTDTGHYDVTLVVTTQEGCKDTTFVENSVLAGIKPDSVDFQYFPGSPICNSANVQFISTAGFIDTNIQVNTWYWPFQEVFYDPNREGVGLSEVLRYVGGWDSLAGYDTVHFYHLAGYNGCMDTVWQDIIFYGPDEEITLGVDSVVASAFGSCGSPISLELTPQGGDYDTVMAFDLINLQTGIVTPLNAQDTSLILLTDPGEYLLQFIISDFPDTVLNLPACIGANFQAILAIDSNSMGFETTMLDGCLENNAFAFADTSFSLLGKVSRWLWSFGDGDTLANGWYDEVIYYDTTNVYLGGGSQITSNHNHNGRTWGTYRAPVHHYQDTGTYTVTCMITNAIPNGRVSGGGDLADSLYCITFHQTTVQVHNVYPGFTTSPEHGCRDSIITFTDTTVSTGPLVDWRWRFFDTTDVATDSNAIAAVAFGITGVYSAELIATNQAGCTDTITKYFNTEITWPTPLANTPSPFICVGDSAVFLNTSFGDNPTYVWDFDDGDSSTAYNVWHTFQNPGWHRVSLTATDENGCTDVYYINDSIYVSPIPIADFDADTIISPCAPLPVIFSDSSQGDIAQWSWDFGDDANSQNTNPIHTYTHSGDYDVTLEVTTVHGCRDTIVKSNYVHVGGPFGTVSVSPDSICAPGPVTFDYDLSNTALITWDFGDGNVQDIPVPSQQGSQVHVYDSAGIVNPVIILEDPDGCRWIVPGNYTIFADKVEVTFTASDTVLCDSSQVFFSSQAQSAWPSTLHWDFGNGQSSTQQAELITYTNTGIYPVTLTVTSPYCTAAHTKTVEVMLEPEVLIEPTAFHACVPGNVLFGGQNLNPQATVTGWEWFVNGQSQQYDSLVYLDFATTGWQIVTLRGYYANGQCHTDTTFNLWGAPSPTADFDFNPQVPSVGNAEITFTNKSVDANLWNWDFGDGGQSTVEHPVHRYNVGGMHPVMLVAKDEFECADTAVKVVQVIPRIANVFTPNGDGVNDTYFVMERLNFTRFDLTIFNRWGQEVYVTYNYENGWDGYFEGVQAPDGVYFWDLWYDFEGNPGRDLHLTGYVHLIWGQGSQPPTQWMWEKR